MTNEGIEYLRQYLHLPPEIVPSTLKRATRSEASRPRAAPRSDGPRGGEDRQSYRRAPGADGRGDKKGDVGAGAGDVELVSYCGNNIRIFILNFEDILLILKFSFIFSEEDSAVDQDHNKHLYKMKTFKNIIL